MIGWEGVGCQIFSLSGFIHMYMYSDQLDHDGHDNEIVMIHESSETF